MIQWVAGIQNGDFPDKLHCWILEGTCLQVASARCSQPTRIVTKVTHKLNQLDSEFVSALAQLNLIRSEVSTLREGDRVTGYAVDVLLDAIDKLNEAAENLEDSQWLLTQLQSK